MATPNYAFWDLQDEFSPLHAAALCCDLEPENWTNNVNNNPVPVPVRVKEKQLREEVTLRVTRVMRRKMVFFDPSHYPHGLRDREPRSLFEEVEKDPRYFRMDLRAWAEGKGLRPPFLFPEDRKKPSTPAEPYSDKEEKKLLEILSALLRTCYGGDVVEDLLSGKSSRFGEVYADISRRIDIDEKTLRKYLKRLPLPPA